VKDVLEYVARNLVDDPDSVEVTEERSGDTVRLSLHVAPDDMGKVIGRGGRTARAIRTIVSMAGTKAGVKTFVDIVD
jgi:predicted RNA-binding protein YlqC (UPF0109 family)